MIKLYYHCLCKTTELNTSHLCFVLLCVCVMDAKVTRQIDNFGINCIQNHEIMLE